MEHFADQTTAIMALSVVLIIAILSILGFYSFFKERREHRKREEYRKNYFKNAALKRMAERRFEQNEKRCVWAKHAGSDRKHVYKV